MHINMIKKIYTISSTISYIEDNKSMIMYGCVCEGGGLYNAYKGRGIVHGILKYCELKI